MTTTPTGWYEIRLEGRLEDRWAAWFDGHDPHPTARTAAASPSSAARWRTRRRCTDCWRRLRDLGAAAHLGRARRAHPSSAARVSTTCSRHGPAARARPAATARGRSGRCPSALLAAEPDPARGRGAAAAPARRRTGGDAGRRPVRARFPAPLVVHIVGAAVYVVVGCLQFLPRVPAPSPGLAPAGRSGAGGRRAARRRARRSWMTLVYARSPAPATARSRSGWSSPPRWPPASCSASTPPGRRDLPPTGPG